MLQFTEQIQYSYRQTAVIKEGRQWEQEEEVDKKQL